jgi:hypothetical protein
MNARRTVRACHTSRVPWLASVLVGTHTQVVHSILAACVVVPLACEPVGAPPLAPGELVAVEALGTIQSDGAFVYYMDDANAGGSPLALRLMRVPVNGGAPTTLSPLPSPTFETTHELPGFVIDKTTAYVAIDTQVFAIPLIGGSATKLVDSVQVISSLTLDASSLYWLEGTAGTTYVQRLVKMPKQGGSAPALVTAGTLAWSPMEMAVDGTNVYWPGASSSNAANDIISSIPVDGGATTVLVTGQSRPFAVASDSQFLYWMNAGVGQRGDPVGQLVAAPLAPPSTPVVLAQNLSVPSQPNEVQVSGGTVFWLDASGVRSASNGGLTTVVTVAAPDAILMFTIDSANVYWATYHGLFSAPR